MVWHRVDQFRQQLLRLPRRKKRVLQVVVDVVLVWIALWLAFVVRLGDFGAVHPFAGHGWLFISAPLIALPLFIRFGMYRAVMRYLGNDALVAIAKAVSLSALILAWWCTGTGKAYSDTALDGLQLLVAEPRPAGWPASDDAAVLYGRLVRSQCKDECCPW